MSTGGTMNQTAKTASAGTSLVGRSGHSYTIERVLQEKENPPQCVYLAISTARKYILKDVLPSEFQRVHDMQRSLNNSPFLRLVHDTIPSESMFVYEYLTDHLLSLAKQDLPITQIKRILKDSLRGLAVLHDQNIVHADIKANNILVDYDERKDGIVIKRVQLADLEDAAHVPPGSHIVGFQVGNQMWRSPEAHAQGSVGKPSDIFSFGIVCIYAVLKLVVFAVNKEELHEDLEPLSIILERQISYFANEDSMKAFLNYLGESPWVQVFEVIRDGFNTDNPRKPFSLWKGVDKDFKNLIGGMTNFDPEKRLTVHEVLAHPWFSDN